MDTIFFQLYSPIILQPFNGSSEKFFQVIGTQKNLKINIGYNRILDSLYYIYEP